VQTKFLLKGLECYKDTQVKACNITVHKQLAKHCCLRNDVVVSRLQAALVIEHTSTDIRVLLIVLWQLPHLIYSRWPHQHPCLWT